MAIQLLYIRPTEYTGQSGTFTVDGNTFKTVNNLFFQKEINDDGYYYISCSSTTQQSEANFFMAKYAKPAPDFSILELTIFKRHDYDRNIPVANALKAGLYDCKIDMYWGVFDNELATLSDVLITNLQNGEVLKWDVSSLKWINATDQGGPATLGGLSDVTLTASALNQVLTYDGAQWVNQAPTPAPIDLADITDVTIANVGPGDDFAYNVGTLGYENIPPLIKNGVWVASDAPTSTPAAGEFSILGGAPNNFYINEIDKLGRNFGIQLSNWFIPHVRDMSFYSSNAAPLIIKIDSPLVNNAGVWGANTMTSPIALTPGAAYRGELDAQNLLFSDKNNNVSLNQNDEFGTGIDNVSLNGDFSSNITSGSGNVFVGASAAVTDGAVSNNVLMGRNASSGFDNSICIGTGATSNQPNSLTITNMTIDNTASAGAAGSPPVSVDGYLRVNINNVIYRIPLYV
jgi:hypothetical protein